METLLTASALALTGAFALVWQSRARAARRWRAALDAYAEREIARFRGLKGLENRSQEGYPT